MVLNNEVVYSLLQKDLKYPGNDGAVIEARNIVLYGPKVNSLKHIAPIKQMLLRAVVGKSEKLTPEERQVLTDYKSNNPQEDEEVSKTQEGEFLLAAISSSPDTDYTDFLEKFKTLIKQPALALIDGEVAITDALLSKMDLHEMEALAGEYLANFILTSASMK